MKIFKFMLIAILVAMSFACSEDDETIEIIYEVTGSAASFSVTYANSNEDTEQVNPVGNGWTYKIYDAKDGQFLYIAAQNRHETGSVTVTIYKDGNVLQKSTSAGAYVIATASTSL